jgi:hypothetical protein
MRLLTAAIVIGPLMLSGALLAADQPPPVLASGALVRLVAAGQSTADRDAYTQRARDEIRAWQRKLYDYSETADAKAKAAGNATENDLNKAWIKAAAASRRLQVMGADGWERTKISFEAASHELAEAWRKLHPEDK